LKKFFLSSVDINCCRLSHNLLQSRNVQKANAVVATPLGTEIPFEDNCVNISPKEEFLPPTVGTSAMPISLFFINFCIK